MLFVLVAESNTLRALTGKTLSDRMGDKESRWDHQKEIKIIDLARHLELQKKRICLKLGIPLKTSRKFTSKKKQRE